MPAHTTLADAPMRVPLPARHYNNVNRSRVVSMLQVVPPRHAPIARAQTRGRRDRQRSGEFASSQMTGIVAVVKGMLSIKEEATAETHNTSKIATNI